MSLAHESESVSAPESVSVTGKKSKKTSAAKAAVEEEAVSLEVPSSLKKSKRTKSVGASGESSSKHDAVPIITEAAIEKTPKKLKKIK